MGLLAEGTPDLTTVGGVLGAAFALVLAMGRLFLGQLDKKDTQSKELAAAFKESLIKRDLKLEEVVRIFSTELQEMRGENRRINDKLFEANSEMVEVMTEMKGELRNNIAVVSEMKAVLHGIVLQLGKSG